MATILKRVTNGVSIGARHTVTSADVIDTYVELDFQINNALVASMLVTAITTNINVALADAVITYPSNGKVRIAQSATVFALANSLKTVMNAHAADLAEHATAIDDVNFPVATADATDLTTLLALTGALLTAYDVHDDDAELGVGWAYHIAQEAGDHTPVSVVTPTTLAEAITRLNDLKVKYNAHDADATCHTTGSTHQEATADASATFVLIAGQVISVVANKNPQAVA